MKLTLDQSKVLESIRGQEQIAAKLIAKENGLSMERTYKAIQALIEMGAMKIVPRTKSSYTDLIEEYDVEGNKSESDTTGSADRMAEMMHMPRVGPEMREKIRAEMKKNPSRAELAKRLGIPKTMLNQVIIELRGAK